MKKLLPRSALMPGMVLAEALCREDGALLLPAATTLTRRHLELLPFWRVAGAVVEHAAAGKPADQQGAPRLHGLPLQAGQRHLRGRPRHRVPMRVPRGGRGRVRRVLLRALRHQGLGRGQGGEGGGAGEKAGGEDTVVNYDKR